MPHCLTASSIQWDLSSRRSRREHSRRRLRSIKKDDIRVLYNHDQNYVLGRVKSKTLTVEENEKGLKYKVTPPNTIWAKDLMVSIERGNVSQNSIGFELDKETCPSPEESSQDSD